MTDEIKQKGIDMTAAELGFGAALPTQYIAPAAVSSGADLLVEDEFIWGLVAAAIVLFGGVAAACRAICWGTPRSCKTTWYGALDVKCK